MNLAEWKQLYESSRMETYYQTPAKPRNNKRNKHKAVTFHQEPYSPSVDGPTAEAASGLVISTGGLGLYQPGGNNNHQSYAALMVLSDVFIDLFS